MNLLGWIACWAGIHSPTPGVRREWSIAWSCRRCGHISPGGVVERRKRPFVNTPSPRPSKRVRASPYR